MFFTRVGLLQERDAAFGSLIRLLRTHTSTLTEVPCAVRQRGLRSPCVPHVLSPHADLARQLPAQGRAGASEALDQAPELVSGTGTPPSTRFTLCCPSPFSLWFRFSHVREGPGCSLDRPVFVKSTPSRHPAFRHI